eukprot:jgi/Picre1/28749/NNA_004148.t1
MSGDSTGYSIGRGGVEKVVRIASAKIELLRMPQKSSVALNEIFFSLDIPGLSVSIIDAYPREISLITVLGINLQFDRLLMPNGIGSQIGFVADSLQADNQMPESEKTTTAAADAFVRLRLLSASRVDLSVSFQNNPQSRPLKGFELQQLNLSQSSLTQRIIERIRSDLIGAAFSLISTFGLERKLTVRTEHQQAQPQELSRDILCFPKTPQASQIKFIASKLLSKYYQDPQRQDHRWAMRHQARAALPQDKAVEDFPLQMPCTAFEKSWQTNPRRSPVVHFWNPVPPPGYKPVGSVATLGPEQPVAPVPCFRDDITLRGRQILATDRPHVAFPEEYSLIWRFNGERPVTMWMPVPPKGYKAMGAIILNSATTPSLDDYVFYEKTWCRKPRYLIRLYGHTTQMPSKQNCKHLRTQQQRHHSANPSNRSNWETISSRVPNKLRPSTCQINGKYLYGK